MYFKLKSSNYLVVFELLCKSSVIIWIRERIHLCFCLLTQLEERERGENKNYDRCIYNQTKKTHQT